MSSSVSIHAPTWGATGVKIKVHHVLIRFNPRTHVGCDDTCHKVRTYKGVSIHAPTWGATVAAFLILSKSKVSIHAPTWGATTVFVKRKTVLEVSIHAPTWGATFDHIGYQPIAVFQSTHPRGVRQSNKIVL